MSRSFKTLVCVLALLVAAGAPAPAEEARPRLRIGIVTDGLYQRSTGFVDVFRTEITAVCGERYAVSFPEAAQVDGSWTRQGLSAAVDLLFADPGVDLVMAVGPAVSEHICRLAVRPKPVVAVFAFGNHASRCSEAANLRVNPVVLGEMVARDLRGFRRVIPFERVAVLTDAAFMASVDLAAVRDRARGEGIVAEFVPVEPGASGIADELPPGTDAVYLMGLQQLDQETFKALVGELTLAGLPTFSLIGESEVEQGVLAGMNPRSVVAPIARASALDVLDLMEGIHEKRPPSILPSSRLTVNMATARALGLNLRWDVISEARLVNEEKARSGRPIDLGNAIERAVEANLDLLVRERVVAAGAEDVREARAVWRPHLEAAVGGVAIDEEHAIPAMGQYARFASGSLALTQLLYSENASANVAVRRRLQEARELDWEALRLDVARAAVGAYLDLMRAEALQRIRQDDVDLHRTNLDLARMRRSVGSAGAAEVHRWEAALASARAVVLEARALRRQAERQLSRLLDLPLTTRWQAQQPELEAALDQIGGAGDAVLLDTPDGFDRLIVTLVDEGLASAPELAALDAAIAAQERVHAAARRAAYVPTVGFAAELARIVAKDEDAGIDLGPVGEIIPPFADTSWNVGVQATLPLATGGARKAQRIRSYEELERLRLDRRRAEDQLRQRILSALDTAAASWPAISLRREAAEAAARTRELVRDAYARGAASILDLLDAQNAALSAELAAVTAVYDFVDDWAEVERAVAGREVLGRTE